MEIKDIYRVYQQHPSVQTDTRKLQPGDLFFALKGPNFNGNLFARQALDAGAAYAIIDDAAYAIPEKTILVEDTLQTLQQLARHHRRQFRIPFIAVTGSNGKTTTKELIHALLSTTFRTYTTRGNLNNHIGVPLTLLSIRPDAQVAVIEMGANHLREIAGYCLIAEPTHGLITNCGKAHLEGFGSLEGVRKGKGELFDYLRTRSDGTAFIMKDYDYLIEMSQGIARIISYGSSDAMVTGQIRESDTLLNVELAFDGLKMPLSTRLVGDYNLPNILAAAAVGRELGVSAGNIITAIGNYHPSNSRSQLVQEGTNSIILDAYNANPSSMRLAIENLVQLPASRKMLMLGAMAEMGAETEKEHEQLVALIQQNDWENVILVGRQFEPFKNNFRYFETAMEAAQWVTMQDFQDSLILIKGSRSSQMELLYEAIVKRSS
ncbi:UDP-N-acetylmuramoyl-tripeptide--D-alanyl-D-alanine ligase [Niabella terrae]